MQKIIDSVFSDPIQVLLLKEFNLTNRVKIHRRRKCIHIKYVLHVLILVTAILISCGATFSFYRSVSGYVVCYLFFAYRKKLQNKMVQRHCNLE